MDIPDGCGGLIALLSFLLDLGAGPGAERRQGRQAGGGIAETSFREVHVYLQTALGWLSVDGEDRSGLLRRRRPGESRVSEPRWALRSASPRPSGCAPPRAPPRAMPSRPALSAPGPRGFCAF